MSQVAYSSFLLQISYFSSNNNNTIITPIKEKIYIFLKQTVKYNKVFIEDRKKRKRF